MGHGVRWPSAFEDAGTGPMVSQWTCPLHTQRAVSSIINIRLGDKKLYVKPLISGLDVMNLARERSVFKPTGKMAWERWSY